MQLMNRGEAMDWGLCGVGLLPVDARMRDVMHAQDCLYTLVVKNADGRFDRRVIGSIADYLFAPDDPKARAGADGRAEHAHRLDDGHRGRLQLRPGDRRIQFRQSRRGPRPG